MTSIALMATPTHADLLWTELAAREYCELRSGGVDHDSALQYAINKGMHPEFVDTQVTINGEYISVGVVKFLNQIKLRCQKLHPDAVLSILGSTE